MAEKTVFAQLFQLISRYEFNQCVERHRGHHGLHHFSCWDHDLAIAFAQSTGRDGLRDIEDCLHSQRDNLYHIVPISLRV